MSERHNFSLMLHTPYGLFLTRSLLQAKKIEIFDVFSMNGIANNPASGEFFLENVILKVSQTHFPRISIPRGGINFSRGGA